MENVNNYTINPYFFDPSMEWKDNRHPKYERTKELDTGAADKAMDKAYDTLCDVIEICHHRYMPGYVRKNAERLVPNIVDGLNAFKTLNDMVGKSNMAYKAKRLKELRDIENKKKAVSNKPLKDCSVEEIHQYLAEMKQAA